MDGKYLDNVAGRATQEQAINVTTGASDASKLLRTGADGLIDISFMPPGVGGSDTVTRVAFEDLNAGDLVLIVDDAGTPKARKADASNPAFAAQGFVLASALTGQNVTVYFSRVITGLAGLTIGAQYYLSETAGAITATPVTTSGALSQAVGRAGDTTELIFEPTFGVVMA